MDRQEIGIDMETAGRCMEREILDSYRKWGFSGDEFAVLSALTVGYKEELSEDLRETYQVAGVSHILALSGMHIAVCGDYCVGYCVRWIEVACCDG